ncbi:MAG: hypothetical protein GC165_14630 [Armatimonadetes bacterium]|nr:hypothetical protein [Armatimonadota bacterium]
MRAWTNLGDEVPNYAVRSTDESWQNTERVYLLCKRRFHVKDSSYPDKWVVIEIRLTDLMSLSSGDLRPWMVNCYDIGNPMPLEVLDFGELRLEGCPKLIVANHPPDEDEEKMLHNSPW